MSRTYAALTVLALVLVAGCAGAGGSDGGTRTITVTDTGQVEAEPNRATVELTATGTGPDAATAQRRLTRNATDLRNALDEAGVGEERIRTVRYDIYTDRRPEPDEPRSRAVHAFEVTVDGVDRVGPVVDAAVGSGASEVGGVRLGLTAERRDELRQQALGRAMAGARTEAGTIAANGNLTVAGVASATTADVDIGGPLVRTEAAALAGDAGGTSIESGPVTVTATVQVTYNATAT